MDFVKSFENLCYYFSKPKKGMGIFLIASGLILGFWFFGYIIFLFSEGKTSAQELSYPFAVAVAAINIIMHGKNEIRLISQNKI